MNSNQIQELITLIGPTLINLIAVIAVVLKVFREFKTLTENLTALKIKINDNKELQELLDLNRRVVQENYELKKALNEILTKIDHIERK